ncbi:MAG: translation initiation factor IF-1 [bacterium]
MTQKFEAEGIIVQALPGTEFMVELELGGKKRILKGYVSGKMRQNYIKILPGDKVKVELTPYDKNICRIIYRSK